MGSFVYSREGQVLSMKIIQSDQARNKATKISLNLKGNGGYKFSVVIFILRRFYTVRKSCVENISSFSFVPCGIVYSQIVTNLSISISFLVINISSISLIMKNTKQINLLIRMNNLFSIIISMCS